MDRSRLAAVAVTVVAAALLTACVAESTEPPPPTLEEMQAVRDGQAEAWWESMFPDRPMPQVEVIEEIPSTESARRMTDCLAEAEIPGVKIYGPGEWGFTSTRDGDEQLALERWWVCGQLYPVQLEEFAVMSAAQLEWLHDYFVRRYEPCMAQYGFALTGLPPKSDFMADSFGFPAWLPYDATVHPIPTAEEWAMLAQRCPLPEWIEPFVGPM